MPGEGGDGLRIRVEEPRRVEAEEENEVGLPDRRGGAEEQGRAIRRAGKPARAEKAVLDSTISRAWWLLANTC